MVPAGVVPPILALIVTFFPAPEILHGAFVIVVTVPPVRTLAFVVESVAVPCVLVPVKVVLMLALATPLPDAVFATRIKVGSVPALIE